MEPPAPESREPKTRRLLISFTPAELERLIAWSRADEREPEQAIRYLLRDVLNGTGVPA